MFGFLNIYKPVGMTSHDVVSVLRKLTKIKQIGHTGTLDPFAEGVLPIAIGKATRLIEYLDDDKAYVGRFNFGKSTTTYDTEGEVTETFDTKLTEEEIKTALPKFNGQIEQYPPIYSAKKINGKKLYEYAREGKEVEIKPSTVTIYKTELLNFDDNEQFADIYIKCSKGTYIRSIANDLGKLLNNGCYLSKLQRVEAGLFNLDTTVKLDDLKSSEDVMKNLLNPLSCLNLTKQELNEVEYNRIIHGMKIYNRTNTNSGTVLLTKDNNLIAISEITPDGLKPRKVIQQD